MLVLSFIFPASNSLALFKPVDNLESAQVKRAVISPFNDSIIYVASNNSLYKSQDQANNFKKISVFKDEEVQHLFFDPYFADTLYIATSRHLYRWKERLEILFSAPDEETIYSAARHKERIYVGTSQGFHFAFEDSLIWHQSKNLVEAIVYHIEPAKDNIYLSTDKGVYSLREDHKLKRLFVMRKQDEEESQDLVSRIVKVDIFDHRRLWLGTSRGLYKSSDSGKAWEKVYIGGISSLSINCIAQTQLQNNTLYLGTDRGFFKVNFRKCSSQQIFEGLHSSYIWWVTFTDKGKIYLSTSKGLFKETYFTFVSESADKQFSVKEPLINEIQQVVLRYNEVHPDKIKKWRNALKYRALFPDISLDYDKTVTTALGASYNRVQVGPQDWGINLQWDVGDLIWNSYEDDVDTRARLNTQLRLDILDEINRVYFERLRLKREIVSSSLPKEELFSKKLRLEELTAILDGYSGGYFSRRAKELNE